MKKILKKRQCLFVLARPLKRKHQKRRRGKNRENKKKLKIITKEGGAKTKKNKKIEDYHLEKNKQKIKKN